VKIRSQELALGLAIVGLLSYTACTAEKTEMRNQEVNAKQMPKLMDGVFATDDHLAAVYFDLNKSKMTDTAMETVKANAEWLKNQPPFLIRLVGFADSRGSLKKNERLAERRANALRDAYVAVGIAKERMTIVTRGAEEPACQPITEDCLSKSRRTETLLEDKALAKS